MAPFSADPRVHRFGFAAAVHEAFLPLERDLGFRRVRDEPLQVAYEHAPFIVHVLYEADGSYEIGVEVRRGDSPRRFSLTELARFLGVDPPVPDRSVAKSPDEVRAAVERLAPYAVGVVPAMLRMTDDEWAAMVEIQRAWLARYERGE